MRGLHLFTRAEPRQRMIMLAAWHSPHSLTWRWSLYFSWGWRWRPYAWFHRHGNGGGGWSIWVLCIGLNGNWQRPMWYRDLYMRFRDEADQRAGLLWVSDKHPHKIHTPPPLIVPTNRPPSGIQ